MTETSKSEKSKNQSKQLMLTNINFRNCRTITLKSVSLREACFMMYIKLYFSRPVFYGKKI